MITRETSIVEEDIILFCVISFGRYCVDEGSRKRSEQISNEVLLESVLLTRIRIFIICAYKKARKD